MLEPQKKPYRLPVQASGSNVFVNLPIEVRNLYGIEKGDSVIVMAVRGLPRLEGRHEYTPEEIAGATFSFSEYLVEA